MTFRFRKTRKKKCGTKMMYRTVRQAKRAARVQYNRYGSILWPYKCDKCKRFHLTGEAATEYESDSVSPQEDDNNA